MTDVFSFRCCTTRRTRRAQMDLMGLVIIVLLIVVAFGFLLYYSVSSDPSEVTLTFQEETFADAALVSLLDSTVPCNNRYVPVETVVKYFVESNQWPSSSCGSFTSPEAFIRYHAIDVLNDTMSYTQRPYRFSIALDTYGTQNIDPLFKFTSVDLATWRRECVEYSAGSYALPSVRGDILINLDICS